MMDYPPRYSIESRDTEHWDLIERPLGDFVRWTDVVGWRLALDRIRRRLASSCVPDELHLREIADEALR